MAVKKHIITKPTITSPPDGSVDVTTDITSSAYATYTLFIGAHESSDWEFSLSADFSTIDHASYADTVHLTSYPSSLLAPETTWYARVRYNSDNHRSAWSPAVSFTTAAATVATPTVTVTGEPDAVPETPTISTSAFSSTDANETHLSTDWQVVDGNGTVVWESPADTSNLESISVPAGILQTGTTYTFKAHHNGSVTSSLYGETTATTAATFVTYINGPSVIVAGGWNGSVALTAAQKIDIPTSTIGTVFGDLATGKCRLNACSDGTYAVFCGGTDNIVEDIIYSDMEYFTFATLADAAAWGNLTAGVTGSHPVSDGAKGYSMSGRAPDGSMTTNIEVFDFATKGDASVLGNGITARSHGAPFSGKSRLGYGCGYDGAATIASIEYLDPATMTDALSFGDMTLARHTPGGTEDTDGSRWVAACGYASAAVTTVDFVDSATLGNASAWGDMPNAAYFTASSSDGDMGLRIAGNVGGTESTSIDYFSISTLGTAGIFGASLANQAEMPGATSGN